MKLIPLSTGRRSTSKSGFFGVTWDRHCGKWRAQRYVKKNGKTSRLSLGFFYSASEAAEAVKADGSAKKARGFAEVSDEDFEYLSQFSWCLTGDGYASRTAVIDDKSQTVMMHWLVAERMGLTRQGGDIDHKDLRKLNNQRDNIRDATRSQNLCNQGLCKKNTSGVKGVYWHKRDKKYRASIRFGKKTLWSANFSTLEAARLARESKLPEIHGEFARTEQRIVGAVLQESLGNESSAKETLHP